MIENLPNLSSPFIRNPLTIRMGEFLSFGFNLHRVRCSVWVSEWVYKFRRVPAIHPSHRIHISGCHTAVDGNRDVIFVNKIHNSRQYYYCLCFHPIAVVCIHFNPTSSRRSVQCTHTHIVCCCRCTTDTTAAAAAAAASHTVNSVSFYKVWTII